jgi:NAD(P)-dependent dehydrogenase (short-subunit alcohol dehydrogenase family)
MAEGKVAIITGCSSGIGLATTVLFLKKGYNVFGIDRAQFDRSALDALEGGPTEFHFYKVDLLEDGACDGAVKVCIAAFG